MRIAVVPASVAIVLLTTGALMPTCRRTSRLDFAAPTNLGQVINSPAFDGGPNVSADGLTLYFTSDRAGGVGRGDLWVARRSRRDDPFGAPRNLGPAVNSAADEFAPSISADGLTLYFDSNRPGTDGASDVWVVTRADPTQAFGSPRNLGPAVNGAASDGLPSIAADGSSLYFSSRRDGGRGKMDLWLARRGSTSMEFRDVQNLGPGVNGAHDDWGPSISADELSLIFMSDRPGGRGGQDLWLARRVQRTDPFGAARPLTSPVNGPSLEGRPNLSADGAMLYFMSDRPGGVGAMDLWQARAGAP